MEAIVEKEKGKGTLGCGGSRIGMCMSPLSPRLTLRASVVLPQIVEGSMGRGQEGGDLALRRGSCCQQHPGKQCIVCNPTSTRLGGGMGSAPYGAMDDPDVSGNDENFDDVPLTKGYTQVESDYAPQATVTHDLSEENSPVGSHPSQEPIASPPGGGVTMGPPLLCLIEDSDLRSPPEFPRGATSATPLPKFDSRRGAHSGRGPRWGRLMSLVRPRRLPVPHRLKARFVLRRPPLVPGRGTSAAYRLPAQPADLLHNLAVSPGRPPKSVHIPISWRKTGPKTMHRVRPSPRYGNRYVEWVGSGPRDTKSFVASFIAARDYVSPKT